MFLQTLRTLRLVSPLKPRHIVIHSMTCSTLVAICGTGFSPKNHLTVETAQALVLPIAVPIFKFLHIGLSGGSEAPCAVLHPAFHRVRHSFVKPNVVVNLLYRKRKSHCRFSCRQPQFYPSCCFHFLSDLGVCCPLSPPVAPKTRIYVAPAASPTLLGLE